MNLSGKLILVTGASSGIGQETCRVVSNLGAKVILTARNKEKLMQTAATLEGNNHQIEPFDLCEVDDIPEWLGRIVDNFGPLDGVVHCAGLRIIQPIRLWNFKDTDRLMRVNLYACFALAKGLRRKTAHKAGCSLIFVSSVAGFRGDSALAVYSASKAAIIGLTKTLAIELAGDGLRVNCVAPGMVKSQMLNETKSLFTEDQIASIAKLYPLGFGEPKDVANTIAFLIADVSKWITGITLVADGGRSA